ncbi:thioredoxin family protein [Flammeovirga sp. SubArs3]|uniref:thioredoxin family protein n=1 Tax=Flammeovirga sp. SubArs3 TaxID=2995316 RepID=UPI00248C7E6E|nr:thioredoxin family protein [Flammeovirga sp. SubArs3]
MMKLFKTSITVFFLLIVSNVFAQNEVYDPEADAMKDIQTAIKEASKTNKHVFVKVGGNWCSWCKLYAKFSHNDAEISKIMEDEYETVLVNWSKENKNKKAMEYLGYPNRFGYPVFVILDGSGKVLHIQNSAYLESGKGYDKNKVLMFLKGWTAKALDPANYN